MIDPDTGASTVVGSLAGGVDPSAAAFARDGTFYVIDVGTPGAPTLLTVDPLNAAILKRTTLSARLGVTAGLTFDPSTGIACVASGGNGGGNLYTLDTSTGVLATIGSTGLTGTPGGLGGSGGLGGLSFTPNAVLEPASALPVALGLGCLAVASPRRGRAA